MDNQNLKVHAFEFHGKTDEYFRIWIVNTLLTIVTLGMYGPWAKVRTNRYFYGNTQLDGFSFDYLATPMQILQGRMILALGLIAYIALSYLIPGAELLVLLVFLFALPWLMVRALSFKMRNIAYRNIRFGFDGTVKESYAVFLKGALVTLLTLGMGTFWADYIRTRFAFNHLRFGKSDFNTDCNSGDFLKIYLLLAGWSMLIVVLVVIVGALFTTLLGGMPNVFDAESDSVLPSVSMILLIAFAYFVVGIFGYTFMEVSKFNLLASTSLIDGKHRIQSSLKVSHLFWIYSSNLLLVFLSMGLIIPWTKIRVARYRMQNVTLLVEGDLNTILASETEKVSAAGEEIGDYMDVDVGI